MFDVITIGTATRDVFLSSNLFKIVRDPKHLQKLGFKTGEAQCFALGGKIEVEPPIMTIGGGATNAAVTFARQGLKTAALFKIGYDRNGRDVLGDLRKERVTSLCSFDDAKMTAYSVILRSPNGERTILNYRGASEDLTIHNIPHHKLKTRWAYIVPGKIPFGVIMSVVAMLKKNGTRVAMNPSKHYIELGYKKLAPMLKLLDVVTMNREEGAFLTGANFKDEKKIFKKFDDYVPGLAVLTDGPKGVLVSDGTTIYKAGVFKERKIVDRTGAGDAFGSGFVASLAHAEHGGKGSLWFKLWRGGGMSPGVVRFSRNIIEHAIRLGSANATSVVESIGAQPGILRRRQFEHDHRWKHQKVIAKKIS